MSHVQVLQVLVIGKILAWISLLYFSLRLRLIQRYPLVFVYILVTMACSLAMPIAKDRLEPLSYAYVYVGRTLLTTFLAGVVLLWIYRVIGPYRWRDGWRLIVISGLIGLLMLSESSHVWAPWRAVNVASGILAYLGLETLIRARRARIVTLGWNLTVVLMALTIPAAFYALVAVGYSIGLGISYEGVSLWMKVIGAAFWVLLAAGMTEYSPPGGVATAREPGQESSAPLPDREAATENTGVY